MTNILPPVKAALQALAQQWAAAGRLDGKNTSDEQASELFNALVPVFSQVGNFRNKLKSLDEILETHADFRHLEEYIFDLLMLNFIASDSGKLEENYLESEEWLKIEDETSNRGTEWLNLLIYISETLEAGAQPGLQDFLDEYLLTDDELYQDEFFIYEPIIRNAELIDAPVADLVDVAKKMKSDDLGELFVPLMIYFSTGKPENKWQQLESIPFQRPVHMAVLAATWAYQNNMNNL